MAAGVELVDKHPCAVVRNTITKRSIAACFEIFQKRGESLQRRCEQGFPAKVHAFFSPCAASSAFFALARLQPIQFRIL